MSTSRMIVTASEFKAKCLGLLEHVRKTGESISITRREVEIARLVPPLSKQKPWERDCAAQPSYSLLRENLFLSILISMHLLGASCVTGSRSGVPGKSDDAFADLMHFSLLIERKRDGQALSSAEIRWLTDAFTHRGIPPMSMGWGAHAPRVLAIAPSRSRTFCPEHRGEGAAISTRGRVRSPEKSTCTFPR